MKELEKNLHVGDLIYSDFNLKAFNTFGFRVFAKRFFSATSIKSLKHILSIEKPTLILGGGSNMLLRKNIDGLVLKIDLKGKEKIEENQENVILEVGAGENWHEFVQYSLNEGYSGLENLSLIPGSVGASPIQNIGAYGTEIKDVFHHLKAININTLETKTYTKEECKFGYRESIFKHKLKGQYIITSVAYRLNKKENNLNIAYGAIQSKLESLNLPISAKNISKAVIAIRQEKLPDPAKIGNSGSFFKNPEITPSEFEQLLLKYPEAKYYKLPNGKYKIPAGWLIDHAGWKGFSEGEIGVHKNQALVLVNYGNGKGEDVWNLALRIQKDIKTKYDILLEPEVNLIG